MYRRRDRANAEMKNIFYQVIQKRRDNPDEDYEDDILNTLMNAHYKLIYKPIPIHMYIISDICVFLILYQMYYIF